MLMDPYASGVLVEDQHARLVQDIDRYAKDAGIQPRWIASRMGDVCSPKELEYARKLNTHRAGSEIDGLCYFQETTKADPLAGDDARHRARPSGQGRQGGGEPAADPELLPEQGRGGQHCAMAGAGDD